LAQDFPMFGFNRTAVPHGAAAQAHNEVVVQVANVKGSGHSTSLR
jgi:hypothetical protein